MRRLRWSVALCCLLALAGCERVMRDMYDQPVLRPGDRSPLFPQGPAARPPPPGSVAQALGTEAAVSGGQAGAEAARAPDQAEARQRLPARPGMAMV